ncbi:hypothetical protein C8Q78DRAFT_86641 [Trametes maxima]|nr:hypothetical protein C8Q78DRAFT_86641 [Trametes maxima]
MPKETSQGVEPPSSTDSVGASQDCGLLECTPPVSMSLASMSDAGEDQGFDTALAGEPLDSQSVCASVTSTLEIITTRISESKDTIPALRNPSSMTQGQHGTVPAPTEVQADTPGIPTAVTYADAMNLALKHPDMSARILNEPLASTCTSACPSPARTASPICGSAFSVKKADCSEPDSAPLPKTTPNVELKKQAPAHTAERPNWALAPDEPKPARKPRSCGSTRDTPTRGDSREARRRNRGPHVGKADVVPSVTPTPSTKLSGTDASVVQPTPKKRLVPDEDSPRSMRKEKAEPWLRRVGSWIEETSKTPQVCPNTTGTCPNLSETPMASETPESASGSAARYRCIVSRCCLRQQHAWNTGRRDTGMHASGHCS